MRRHAIKLIVCAMLFVLLFTSFLLMGTNASGSQNTVEAVNEELVTVYTGDTLWAIANRFAGDEEDVRYVIYLIKERNGLESTNLYPGQKLVIPSI
ncbi:LysM peptidoglycan-binding domain-containing protein [Paenibacillus harenae]|nr:LysM peptidoglycan-binding domain-containing protein [Paenibacillus harenae]MDQ0058038.1 LysM repeat protein [Paenibacillus harenae]